MQQDALLKCREAKESEINFLVDAFKNTLVELLSKNKDIDILPTNKTLDSCRVLLFNSYKLGYVSYLVELDNTIVGYLVFIADNMAFDLNKNSCTILTLFIEPDYRNLSIAKFLIDSVESELKSKGVNVITAHLQNVKHLPRLFKRWKNRVTKTLQIFLD